MSDGKTRRFTAWAAAWLLVAGVVVSAVPAIQGCEPLVQALTMPGPVTLGKPADNSHCLVCHLDFKKEEISAEHEKEGVGCNSCHGESLAHGDDEFNITTPDVTYGRVEIAPLCTKCHKTHDKGRKYQAFLKKWEDERRPNGRMISAASVCTDCHGNHAVLTPDKQLEPPKPK